ncbi:MAG: TolC family protein [Proteobacteria bacterium]|nr:TolC family protein [Pseudomonadota bacterium]
MQLAPISMHRLVLAGSLGMLVSPQLFGQTIDLAEAIREALDHSPQIKAAEAQVETARWKQIESFSGYLPTIAVSSNYLTNKKYLETDIQLPGATSPVSMPQIIPTTMWTANAQLGIFDGFATTNRTLASGDFKSSAERNLEWKKFQLERDVTLQFYRALAANEILAVAIQNEKNLQDHLNDVRLRKGLGMSTHYDVIRVEVQASEAKSEVINANDNLQMARLKLAELMGSDLTGKIQTPRIPSGQLPTLDSEGIETMGDPSESRPVGRKDLESLKLRVDGLEKSATGLGRHFYPRLSLFAQYQYYNNLNDSPTDKSSFRNAFSTGVTLNWVLFDGLASTSRAYQGLSEKNELEQNLNAQRLKAIFDIQFWKRKFSYYQALQGARKSEIGKSEESLRLARVGQKEGTRTSSDLLDAQSEVFRSKAGAINAQLGSIEALLNMEMATGKPIKLNNRKSAHE